MNQVTLSSDEIVSRVLTMRRQEETAYSYRRYLPKDVAGGNGDNDGDDDDDADPSSLLNVSWREKITQWSFSVVDHFDLSREVVAVSLDLFDRYLATCGNECTGNLALLTSLTTLYIAMKLYDPKKLDLDTLSSLSRGQFVARDVTDMEWKVLAALEWKLHPPTATAFVSHLLLFLPAEASAPARKELTELAKYLTELAVCDSYFVDQRNSIVAFAAILNVMEDLEYSQLSAGIRERFLRDLMERVGLSCGDPLVVTARQRIRAMFTATTNTTTATAPAATVTPSPTASVTISPTSCTEVDTSEVLAVVPATQHQEADSTSMASSTVSSKCRGSSAGGLVDCSNLSRAGGSVDSLSSGKGGSATGGNGYHSSRYSPSPHRPRHRAAVLAGVSACDARLQ